MWHRTLRHDPFWVDHGQTLEIVTLDMLKTRGILECGHVPVQVSYPFMDMRVIVANHAFIGLEQGHIDGIKTNDGHVQPNVRFGNLVAVVVQAWLGGEVCFDAVERAEKAGNCALICFLSFGEAAFASSR